MNRLFEIFNQIKAYLQKNAANLTLSELYILIDKKEKTVEEIKQLSIIFDAIKKMKECIESMGTRFFDVEINAEKSNLDLYDDIETKVKDLVMIIDEFIDTYLTFVIAMDSHSEAFALKKLYSYFSEIRNYLVKKTTAYSRQIIRNETDKANIRILLNDVIDIFLRESSGLQLIQLYNELKGIE